MVDPNFLARLQFALNITFHILFPAITIALSWILFFFKIQHNRTGAVHWMDAYRFWVKVFALSFALGIVSGVTMSFQFGTNWPGFMETVGDIAGPLLAYEVLVAFFLEASFLGIMLFGMNRVSSRVHTISAFLVAFGTTLSAFFILVLNSWMQTPTGFEVVQGRVLPIDWFAIIFNPSMPYRMGHMLLASGLTAAFLLSGVSAYRYLRGDRDASVMVTLKTGVYLAMFLIPMQIVGGDLHGLNTLEHQPAKIAAMEALWHSTHRADLVLFAIPDAVNQVNHFAVTWPGGASWILTHSADGYLKGIDAFDLHPPVAPLFYGFRVMVGIGMLMLAVSWGVGVRLLRGKSLGRWGGRLLVAMTFSGWVATLAGWYVTEIGRQPYLVYGLLKTADAVSKVPSEHLLLSLVGYALLYLFLIVSYISVVFYMARTAQKLEEIDHV